MHRNRQEKSGIAGRNVVITMPCSRHTFRYYPSAIRSKRSAEGKRYAPNLLES